jgi:hypothetical protein
LKHIFKTLCSSSENPFGKIHLKQLEHIDCALMKRESINLAQKSISYVPIKTKRINRRVTIPIHSERFYNHLETCLKENNGSEYLLPKVSERYIKNKSGVVNDSIKVFAYCKIRELKDRTPKAERMRGCQQILLGLFRLYEKRCLTIGKIGDIFQSLLLNFSFRG